LRLELLWLFLGFAALLTGLFPFPCFSALCLQITAENSEVSTYRCMESAPCGHMAHTSPPRTSCETQSKPRLRCMQAPGRSKRPGALCHMVGARRTGSEASGRPHPPSQDTFQAAFVSAPIPPCIHLRACRATLKGACLALQLRSAVRRNPQCAYPSLLLKLRSCNGRC
jgi:hypothetical protein